MHSSEVTMLRIEVRGQVVLELNVAEARLVSAEHNGFTFLSDALAARRFTVVLEIDSAHGYTEIVTLRGDGETLFFRTGPNDRSVVTVQGGVSIAEFEDEVAAFTKEVSDMTSLI